MVVSEDMMVRFEVAADEETFIFKNFSPPMSYPSLISCQCVNVVL